MKDLFGMESSASAQDTMPTAPVNQPAPGPASRAADPISSLQESTGMDKTTIIAIVVGIIGFVLLIVFFACRGRGARRYSDEYDIERPLEGFKTIRKRSKLPSFWPRRSGRSFQPSGTPCSDR